MLYGRFKMQEYLAVLFLAAIARSSEVCPPWTVHYSDSESNSTYCKCGADLGGVVDCSNETLRVLDCYCMTFNRDLNMTLVGHCTARCIYASVPWLPIVSKELDSLNDEFCQHYNREGQLCGKCMANYGPPVYSYSYMRVKCDRSSFRWNILKYITVAFIPLTLFYLAVILLKVNAMDSFMVAYVMLCQLQMAPFEARRLISKSDFVHSKAHVRFSTSLLGIWNLDMFRSIYTPFCIHPDMTTLQVLALDYLIGVYPFVLIACTYIAVKLHDRYPLVVKLCKPFSKLMCIKQEWDISGSLIQAFATFLVLSYVKILNVSFDLLTPVSLWTPEGRRLNQSYVYNAGETLYFGHEHLPYGVLAVVMLTVFNILPAPPLPVSVLLLSQVSTLLSPEQPHSKHLHGYLPGLLSPQAQGKKRNLLAAWALLIVFQQQLLPAASSDIILKPTPVPPGMYQHADVAVILFQAPGMPPSSYLPLMKAMQNSSFHPLWVGIPQFEQDMAAKHDVGTVVRRVLQGMKTQGLNRSIPFFLAVHSQDYAVLVQEYAVNASSSSSLSSAGLTPSGLILLGAFLDRSYRSKDHNYPFPVPTFTVGAELDGVCRISRVLEEFYHRIYTADNISDARKRYPIAVIPGMSHLQFASGEPSDKIKKYDLRPEINETVAHQTTSKYMSLFVELTLSNESIAGLMLVAVETAGMFFAPLLDAYNLEGSTFFKPPCNEGPHTPLCQVGCAWTEQAMVAMADLPQVNVTDTDAIHPAAELLPTYHHPKILSTCPAPTKYCNLTLTSVSENVYYKEKTDSGLVPNSACEIRAKLKSRQSIMLAAGIKNVEFNVSDAGSRCMKLNQLVYNWTLSRADPKTRKRFDSVGVPIHMGEDKGCYENGGLWIYLPMQYAQTKDKSGREILEVRSIQLKTDVKYPIGIFAGVHYCKLLSPAKVMEWVYVDGLRAHMSLSGERAELMACGL